ncbi:hypothetical protein HMPREF3160_05705 [Arthrobacter sp. HMSC06H05]|uniref:Stk1 family PASTA domain-containing Ser/Thr kinase n=1 Tax=Arthrobacter sp. HMSC06H05 TaxID=1581128 RepID=UPI0008A396FB|nr:Stk1 family PASTA domain-containing Ser/Thr kinase [Arthrobacter sp. HMSC06H05]OFT42224.1 hypothetical protein HMPREF3160_05705 [Arthrobacter sp. HMSC06H05]
MTEDEQQDRPRHREEEQAAQPRQHTLNDRYELDRLIGRGGMADVWLARDVLLGRDVAVKILRSDLARDPIFQARFRREAKAVAGLNDPTIVSVFDTGDTDVRIPGEHSSLKVPFIVMEYVAGHTLKERLKHGPLSQKDAINATLGVLAALSSSHKQGIVHRDIKPANVMVTNSGSIKVMDFGIARALADSAATMTQPQTVVGTAQYLSPEQARGDDVDQRSDLYSAGCLLFELLTGRPPFQGDSPVSVAYQHVSEAPPRAQRFNPEIPQAMEELLQVALAKDREDRYQTADEFAAALRSVQRGETPPSPATLATRTLPAAAPAAAIMGAAQMPQNASGHAMNGQPLNAQPVALQESNDDEELEERDKRSRKGLWIASSIFGVLLIVGVVFGLLWMQAERERNAPVNIPSLENLSLEQAQAKLTELELNYEVKEEHSDSVDEGHVISTDPAAGTSVKKQTVVTLMVSEGTDKVKVPRGVIGKNEREARRILEEAKLTVSDDVKTKDSANESQGTVLEVSPKPGTELRFGDEVQLTISSGEVSLPDVTGLEESEAVKKLTSDEYKLEVQVTRAVDDSVDEGTVVSQRPGKGTKTSPGSIVVIVVAEAPEQPSESPSDESEDGGDESDSGEDSEESPSSTIGADE